MQLLTIASLHTLSWLKHCCLHTNCLLMWQISDAAFLLYHLWLLAHGLTTYDTFRQSKSCTGPTQAMAHNTRWANRMKGNFAQAILV